MAGSTRYTGLSTRERSSMGGFAALVAALALAMLLLVRGAPLMFDHRYAYLSTFDITPPPAAPPPPPVRIVRPKPRIARKQLVHRPPRGDAGSHGASVPSPAPLSITPVEAPALSAIDVGSMTVDNGVAAALAAGGAGSGTGNGRGEGAGDEGGGGGTQTPYFRADWIRKPTQADIEREWPRTVAAPAQPIEIILGCEVRTSGHPFRCAIVRASPAGRSLTKIAIRLAEAALVKPVMHGAKVADPHVFIPMLFYKAKSANRSAPP